MKIRPLLIAALASASLASPLVMAHSGAHDDDEKAMPKTCEQLADTKRYISDVAYPKGHLRAFLRDIAIFVCLR